MPDVFVVEPGQVVERPPERVFFAHVPIRHNLLAIRIRLHAEHDIVAQHAHRFRVCAAQQLVDGLHQLLGAHGFIGVQAAVNPDDGFPVAGELSGFRFSNTLGVRQALRDGLVFRKILLVFGRGDDGHVVRAAFGGFADFHQLHAVGFRSQLLPVVLQLGVGGHLVIVTQVEAERFFW